MQTRTKARFSLPWPKMRSGHKSRSGFDPLPVGTWSVGWRASSGSMCRSYRDTGTNCTPIGTSCSPFAARPARISTICGPSRRLARSSEKKSRSQSKPSERRSGSKSRGSAVVRIRTGDHPVNSRGLYQTELRRLTAARPERLQVFSDVTSRRSFERRHNGDRAGLWEAHLRHARARKFSNKDLIAAEALRRVNALHRRPRPQPGSNPRHAGHGPPRGFVGETSGMARRVGYDRHNNGGGCVWHHVLLSIAERL